MPTAIKDKVNISAIYDRIYDIADRLIKKHNPCNIRIETKPAKTHCSYKYNDNALCCVGCKYWDKGCTVKSLACKLFLCQAVKNKVLQKRFQKLREYGRKHLSFTYRDNWGKWNYSVVNKYYTSKEDWLKFMEEKL